MIIEVDDEDILHYGIPRRSGRYPWGSGGGNDYYTNNRTFVQLVQELRTRGHSEKEIYEGFGMTSGEYRASLSNAKAQIKAANISQAQRLADKGNGATAIARRMGESESTVRTWLAAGAADKATKTENTAKVIKDRVDEVKYLDVGKGTETMHGVTSTTWDNAVSMLRAQGYELHQVPILQPGTGKNTNFKILAPPGTTQHDVFVNRDKIQQLQKFTDDNGRTSYGLLPPISISQRRVGVVYAEQGGSKADGVIYVRPGVKDVHLGGQNYAQVRVMVNGTHYLKGMAVYKDDLPDGVDLQFHTNKSDTGHKLDAFKEIKDDANNPFGTVISRQIVEHGGTPKEKVTSAMNIVNEEGKWSTWNRTLSSQMLSKQKPVLAKTQLDMTYEARKNQFDEINNMTNATVRKKLLEDFADGTDSAAVHLKAKALPGQANHVILPLASIKQNEVFAPNYNNGDRVALVRFPHGGPFEIPELTVNNRNHEGRRTIGALSRDAIGIHHTVAERLSGADFDGDTVLVIPNNHGRVSTKPPLEGLKGFDPSRAYPKVPGSKVMKNTQTEMGKISNLITDMSLQGASDSEMTRAVKHSMVVIDAEKKGLNHTLSYNDNNIGELKRKYQSGGASTLISRKKSDVRVPERKLRPASQGGPVNKQTGELVYVPTGRINTHTGQPRTTRSTRLAEAKDAHSLSSGTVIERFYADHSNKLKALANEARRVSVNTPHPKQNPSARKTYKKQVNSLNTKLALAVSNKPLERQALVIANAQFRMAKQANPNMDKATEKKVRFQTLEEARRRTGSDKHKIHIEDDEWEAIQAGAISHSKLTEILDQANMDRVKELAAPKSAKLMSSTKTARAKQMLASGYTRQEVAEHLGVSLTTLDTATG